MRFNRAALVGLVVLAGGAGAIGLLAGRNAIDSPRTTTTTTATRSANTGAELVEFRSEQAGFALSYPKGWILAQSPDPQVALVVAEKDPAENRGGSILVRVTALEAPVSREQLGEARKVTDQIVMSGEGVQLKAQPAEVEQGGLPGLFYFYTFHDPVSGQRGAHSHYFLFRGQTMVSLVFQALPEEDFIRLAPLLDRVAASFRILTPNP